MDINVKATLGDYVIKLAASNNIFRIKSIQSVDLTRFSHSNLSRMFDHFDFLKPWKVFSEPSDSLSHLPFPFLSGTF